MQYRGGFAGSAGQRGGPRPKSPLPRQGGRQTPRREPVIAGRVCVTHSSGWHGARPTASTQPHPASSPEAQEGGLTSAKWQRGSFFFRVLILKTWYTWRVRKFCFSQHSARKSLGLFWGPRHQSCFHSNTQILFAFFTHSLQVQNPVNQCFPSNHCTKLPNHAWVNEPECKTDRKTGRSEYVCSPHGSSPTLQLIFKKLLVRLPWWLSGK